MEGSLALKYLAKLIAEISRLGKITEKNMASYLSVAVLGIELRSRSRYA